MLQRFNTTMYDYHDLESARYNNRIRFNTTMYDYHSVVGLGTALENCFNTTMYDYHKRMAYKLYCRIFVSIQPCTIITLLLLVLSNSSYFVSIQPCTIITIAHFQSGSSAYEFQYNHVRLSQNFSKCRSLGLTFQYNHVRLSPFAELDIFVVPMFQYNHVRLSLFFPSKRFSLLSVSIQPCTIITTR